MASIGVDTFGRKGGARPVGAGMSGVWSACNACGGVFGVAFERGVVWAGAGGASLDIGATSAEVPILLAFVTSHGFDEVFVDFDEVVGDVYPFFN